jgi:drug/metabolite transporter (DMT)-like permease
MSRPSAHALAYAGLAVATVGWTAGFIAGKLALAEMTPLPVAAWRYVAAALMLLPFALRQRPAAGTGPATRPLALMMVCGGVLYPLLFLKALAHTSATNTSLLIALNPAFTILLAPLVGERLAPRRLAGVALAFAGAVLVITRGSVGSAAGGLSAGAGDLLAVAAAAAWATFNLAARGVVAHLSPAFTNFLIYGAGSVALYTLGLADHPVAQLAAASPTAVGSILVMALLSSVVAGQLFLIGVRTVGVSRTVVFVYLVPVLTAFASAVFLGERLAVAQAFGGAAVLAGVYWTTRSGGGAG